MLNKLYSRLIISHSLPILILTPLLGIVLLYLLETRYSLTNLADEFTKQGTLIAELIPANSAVWTDQQTAKIMIEKLSPHIPARLMFLDNKGRLLASSLDSDSERVGQVIQMPVVQDALQDRIDWIIDYNPFMRGRVVDVALPVHNQQNTVIGVVRLSHDIAEIERQIIPLRWLVFLTFFVGTGLALILGFLLAKSLSIPLLRLTDAVTRFMPGQEPLLVPEMGPDEVKQTANSYNHLTQRLYKLELERRQLLTSIVHELGTPLAAIKAAAEALQNGATADPEFSTDLIMGINSQIDQLGLLIDDLALLRESQIRRIELRFSDVNPDEIIRNQCYAFAYLMQQKHIQFSYDIPSDLPTIRADPIRLSQILANLLQNAYRYTPDFGQIHVTAEASTSELAVSTLLICVSDSGPGIPIEEQEKIFQMMYRSPLSKATKDGMGIGLALSKQLAEAHSGTLSVQSTPHSGTVFTLALPIS